MDLLLQAAKVLEQENSGGSPDRVSARSTRGSSSHLLGRVRGESEGSDSFGYKSSLTFLDDNVGSADDEALSGSERRRAGGAGTREVHNQLEKNRRKQMRECFNYLQQCIPSLENKRVATQSILQGAIKHIKGLKKKNVEQEREIQMLAKRKSELKRKYDFEYNRCTEEQQRFAEVMLKLRKPVVSQTPDEDGHTSDSTTTASEGPGNEEDFSEEEKMDDRERGHLSRVNPVVAAKLDGFRKRKLASLDTHPKSTDYIIASMKDAGLLSAPHPPSKSRSSSLSSVSSSSVALKNMLEQKKKQQTNHFTTATTVPSSPSIVIDKSRMKVGIVHSKSSLTSSSSSKSGGSSLMSSHPMISNQLAALPSSLPSVIPPSGADSLGGTVAANSLLHAKSSLTPLSVPMYPGLSDRRKILGLDKPELLNSQIRFSSLPTSTLSTDASLKTQSDIFIPTNMSSDNSSSLMAVEATRSTSLEYKPPDTSTPFLTADAANLSALSILQAANSSLSGTGAKVIPSIIPMSLLRGIPFNSGLSPVTMTLASTNPSSSSMESSITAMPGGMTAAFLPPKASQQQPLASEILLTSPVKSSTNNSPELTTSMSQVAALLAPPLASTLPGASFITTAPNLSSSVPRANLTLQDSLKTMAIAPTLLPFTVTGGPLTTNTTQSVSPMTPGLRFYTSLSHNSVVGAAPLNGQTASLMPAVMRLGVLQNFIPAHVQVQSPQMIAQPIVVVTAPSTIISPVDSAPAVPSSHPVNATQPSASSSSVL